MKSIRTIVLDQIRQTANKLKKGDAEERKTSESWFKRFNQKFSASQMDELNLEKRGAFTIVFIRFTSLVVQDERALHLKLSLQIKNIDLIIRENDIIDSLRNLQNHVNFFKSALEQEENLKAKVISHIKKNFIKVLSKEIEKNKQSSFSVPSKETGISKQVKHGNFNSSLSIDDYLSYVVSGGDNTAEPLKFLLCFTVKGLFVDFKIERSDTLVDVEIKEIVGKDLLAVNKEIRPFFEISSNTKIFYSIRPIKLVYT